jgi:hypothetical protein
VDHLAYLFLSYMVLAITLGWATLRLCNKKEPHSNTAAKVTVISGCIVGMAVSQLGWFW